MVIRTMGNAKLGEDLEPISWLDTKLERKTGTDWLFGDTFALDASSLNDTDANGHELLCFGFVGKSSSPKSAKIVLYCARKCFFKSIL